MRKFLDSFNKTQKLWLEFPFLPPNRSDDRWYGEVGLEGGSQQCRLSLIKLMISWDKDITVVLLNRFTLKNKLCIAFVLVMFNHKTCGHKGKGAGLGSGKDPREKKRNSGNHTWAKARKSGGEEEGCPLHVTRALVGFVHCVFAALSP